MLDAMSSQMLDRNSQKWRQSLDVTFAVDWDVKDQFIQANIIKLPAWEDAIFTEAEHAYELHHENPTRSDTSRPVQSQKQARWLKFRIYEEEKLYYPCSENKGADQLRSLLICAFVFT